MLQRVQTLYLFLAALCVFMLFIFAVGKITIVDDTFNYTIHGMDYSVDGESKTYSYMPFSIMSAAVGIFSLLTIFLYKKRKVQLQFGRLNYILHIALIVLLYLALDNAAGQLPNHDVAHIGYTGLYFPVASIAFIFLANRSIKKDEELVQSLNRIR